MSTTRPHGWVHAVSRLGQSLSAAHRTKAMDRSIARTARPYGIGARASRVLERPWRQSASSMTKSSCRAQQSSTAYADRAAGVGSWAVETQERACDREGVWTDE